MRISLAVQQMPASCTPLAPTFAHSAWTSGNCEAATMASESVGSWPWTTMFTSSSLNTPVLNVPRIGMGVPNMMSCRSVAMQRPVPSAMPMRSVASSRFTGSASLPPDVRCIASSISLWTLETSRPSERHISNSLEGVRSRSQLRSFTAWPRSMRSTSRSRQRRGVPMAVRLARKIEELERRKVNVGVLDINLYRDDHVKSPDEWQPVPGALDAVARLNQAGWHAVVATNQSGIGRGMIDMASINLVHAHMMRCMAAAGGRIDAVFFCPHAPEDHCDCRKPAPGLMVEIGLRYAPRKGTEASVSWVHSRSEADLNAFSVGAPTTLKKVEIWKLKPTNQGFREAQKNRNWEPDTK